MQTRTNQLLAQMRRQIDSATQTMEAPADDATPAQITEKANQMRREIRAAWRPAINDQFKPILQDGLGDAIDALVQNGRQMLDERVQQIFARSSPANGAFASGSLEKAVWDAMQSRYANNGAEANLREQNRRIWLNTG